MEYKELATQILKYIGGKKNIQDLTHCATRLRFHLNDDKLINVERLEELQGVLGVVNMGGQCQIIIGNNVGKVCTTIKDIAGISHEQIQLKNNKKIITRIFDTITGIFTPVLPAITAAGMLKAVMTLLMVTNILSVESDTYKILSFIADAAFYFLPILLADSAANKFGCNRYLAITIGGVLLHPNFLGMLTAAETGKIMFFGLPISFASYSGSVLPIILSVWFMSYVEKFAEKRIPNMIKFFTKPLLIMLVTAPISIIVIGPIGNTLSGFVGSIMTTMSHVAPWLVPFVIGAFLPLLVMTGLHYAIFPLTFNNIATFGYDGLISPGTIVTNISQGAAALGVAFKTKQTDLKQLAISSGLTAMLGGVTEPALYGVNLKYRTPLIAAMIGGGIGGLFNGIFQVKRYSAGVAGLLTLPTYIGPDGLHNFVMTCLGILIAVVITFILSYILFKDDENVKVKKTSVSQVHSLLTSPMTGQIMPISEMDDPTFSKEIIGNGVAIVPEIGRVVAPCDGVISALFNTKHAIGLTSTDGYEILIHIGVDTVKLNGQYFQTMVEQGQTVSKGDLLIEFDLQAILDAGYDITTPVVITNLENSSQINISAKGNIKEQELLFDINKL